MGRLITAGFETGSLQELNGGERLVSVSSDYARSGVYSLKLLGAPIAGATGYKNHVFGADETEIYFRVAWYLDATGISGYPHLLFMDSNGDQQLCLMFNGPTQTFKLYRGNSGILTSPGTLIASGNIVLRASSWYLLEGHVIFHRVTGECTLKVNAITDIAYIGGTIPEDAGETNRSFQFFGPLGGGYLYIDDVAFNDTDGSFENSYPGLGGVFFLKANGPGATQDFTPSTGSDHDALVDDVPANTTDWVQGENAGDLELFEIENTPTYVTQINVVQPVFQAAVAVSGSNELRDVVRADGIEYPGPTTQTIISIAPAYVLYRGDTYYEQPDGVSGAFDAAALDVLQVGFEIPELGS